MSHTPKRLRRARAEHGVTQIEVARALQWTPGHLSGVERGVIPLSEKGYVKVEAAIRRAARSNGVRRRTGGRGRPIGS